MKALIDQIKLQKDVYLTGTLIMGSLYLVGMILHDILVALDDTFTTSLYLGSMMALGGIAVFVFFAVGVHLATMFHYAVAMGCTRKSFLPAYMAATFFSFLMLAVELKLMNFLEGLKLELMYPTLIQLNPVEAVMQWKCLLGIALVGTALGVLVGSLLIKFGKAAMAVLWIVFMAVCIGGPRLLEFCLHHQDNVFAKTLMEVFHALAKLGSAAAPVLIIATAAVLLGISYLLLRRQQVNI